MPAGMISRVALISFIDIVSWAIDFIYRVVEKFDGGNFDIFDALQLDRQNLTCQIVLKWMV